MSGEAMVNPNTKGFDHFTDEAFYYGWCENWKGVGNCILGYTDQAVLGDKARKEDRVLYV